MKITKFEEIIIEFIDKNKEKFFLIIVSLIGVLARFAGKDYLSGDMLGFFVKWYETFRDNGHILALNKPVGNYNVLFETIICFMSYSSIDPVIQLKIFECIFDYILAVVVALIVKSCLANEGEARAKLVAEFAYAGILVLPEVYLNSSVWGQCDAIYTTFVLLSIYLLQKKSNIWAFVALGIAFAFKLQTIFIIPFILIYFICKKTFSCFNFFISIFALWFSGIVAYTQGRRLLEPFIIYYHQSGQYGDMWKNTNSFWILIGDDYANLGTSAMCVTMVLLGLCLYLVMNNKIKIDTTEEYYRLATWIVWTCFLFLPAMHERYSFLANMLLFVLLCINVKKYVPYFLVSSVTTLLTYGRYLYDGLAENIEIWQVFIYVVAYVAFTVLVLYDSREKSEINV